MKLRTPSTGPAPSDFQPLIALILDLVETRSLESPRSLPSTDWPCDHPVNKAGVKATGMRLCLRTRSNQSENILRNRESKRA
jgi:hypothetical protein